jgi:hypothetical protein
MASKKITTVPEKKGFSGLLLVKAKEQDYTPTALLDRMGNGKEDRPVFSIRPFTSVERYEIEAVDEMVKAESFAWCKEKGIDPANLDTYQLLALNSFLKSKHITARAEKVLRKCVSKVNGVDLTDEIFERFHPKLSEDLFAEVKRISYLTEDDTINL